MKIEFHSPDLDPLLRSMLRVIHERSSFVLNWANAAAMEARANARAKPGRNYWRELARRTRVRRISGSTAEVSSDQIGANLKQYGGIVRPVRKSVLTIPIAPEAKGKRASELDRPSRPLFRPKGTKLLGYSKGRGKGQVFVPLFVLAPRAVQRPDPWFPSEERINRLGRREAALLLRQEEALWNTRH